MNLRLVPAIDCIAKFFLALYEVASLVRTHLFGLTSP